MTKWQIIGMTKIIKKWYIFFLYWFPPHYYLGGVVTRILYYCAAIIWFEGSGDEIAVTQSLRDVRAQAYHTHRKKLVRGETYVKMKE